MSKKTHQKQLARARSKRYATTKVQRRRRRGLAFGLGAVGFLVAGGILYAITRGGADPVAAPTNATPTASSTAAPGRSCADGADTPTPEPKPTYDAKPDLTIDTSKTYTATIETSCGRIEAELFDDLAPETVNSFVFLAREGFYDGLTFHRIIETFMIQGGDPSGTGSGGPGYTIPGETDASQERGFPPGTLAMANSTGPDSAGSQFFIVHEDAEHLTPEGYAAFGEVTGGQRVVDRIAGVTVGPDDRPLQPVYIESITIDETGG